MFPRLRIIERFDDCKNSLGRAVITRYVCLAVSRSSHLRGAAIGRSKRRGRGWGVTYRRSCVQVLLCPRRTFENVRVTIISSADRLFFSSSFSHCCATLAFQTGVARARIEFDLWTSLIYLIGFCTFFERVIRRVRKSSSSSSYSSFIIAFYYKVFHRLFQSHCSYISTKVTSSYNVNARNIRFISFHSNNAIYTSQTHKFPCRALVALKRIARFTDSADATHGAVYIAFNLRRPRRLYTGFSWLFESARAMQWMFSTREEIHIFGIAQMTIISEM